MGDFNIDIKDDKLCHTKMKHVIEINDLHQLINKLTRVTAHSESIIDHLYTSRPEFVKAFRFQPLPAVIRQIACKKVTTYHKTLSII